MDVNFGLVHKSSSGKGHGQESSRHKQLFFHDHSDLKEFMSGYVADRKSQSVVSRHTNLIIFLRY